MHWAPTQSFALPTDFQLARSSMADAGQGAESKFAPTAQNLALLQALGYGGQGLTDLPGSDYGFGAQPVWSDDARTWLANNGFNLGVAHDPGTTPGGRPEYFGLTGQDGKFVNGQSDPTMTNSDTLMDQIAMFAMLAGPFAGAIGAAGEGAGALSGAASGLEATLPTVADYGLTSLSSVGSDAAASFLGGGGAALGGTAANVLPTVVTTGAAAGGSLLPAALTASAAAGSALQPSYSPPPEGSNLVQNKVDPWQKVKDGALKGAAKGGLTSAIKGDNPLKGALTGAVGGAIGGGIGSIGDGSAGQAMSLDNGGGDLIPGGFDGFDVPTDTNSILNNVGGFSGPAVNIGGDMGWTDWLSGLGSLGGGDGTLDLGSFGDPGFQWDLSGVDGGDYSHEGLNYSGWGGLDPVTNSPVNSGGSDWLDTLKGWFTAVPNGSGGTKPNPMGGAISALLGAGLGAASGGGTSTKTSEPWAAAQPFLTNVLGDAGSMLTSLRQNPFTPQQTQAYSTAYAGLDQSRSALPGLLNWGQQAMQRQSTTPSYEQLFGGGQAMPAQPQQMPGGLLNQQQQPMAQAGGPGGLLGNDDRMKALMARGRGLIG